MFTRCADYSANSKISEVKRSFMPKRSNQDATIQNDVRVSPQYSVVWWIILAVASSQLNFHAAVFNIANGDVQNLIAAISIANTNGQPDVLNLANNGVYSLAAIDNSTDGLNGLPSIINDGPGNGVIINGNGSILQRGIASGLGLLRILHIGDNGVLEVNSTRIQNGRALGQGAGIFNRGRLVLDQCVVSDNLVLNIPGLPATPLGGGGIFNVGILELKETMILNNTVLAATERLVGVNGMDAVGGGICNSMEGIASVANSCVASNLVKGGDVLQDRAWGGSGRGGGIYNEPGARLELINCTLSYNRALGGNGGAFLHSGAITEGGAIYGGRTDSTVGTNIHITIFNSTIVFNTALEGSHPIVVAGLLSQGGGIVATYGITSFPAIPVFIRNSIIASNIAGSTPDIMGLAYASYPDVRGRVISGGNNLIGNVAGLIGFSPIEDLLGTESAPIDPIVGPLSKNGGLTLTHALLQSSPAIDAGSTNVDDAPRFDQRGLGFPRIVRGRIDIGAFEVQAATPPVFESCPTIIMTTNDPGLCFSSQRFLVTASGTPEPVIICRLGTNIINPPFSFPVGTSVITCTASNAAGTTNCEFAVIVHDAEPPAFSSLQSTPSILWPPNHQMVPIILSAKATDNCGSTILRIISATSNEPGDSVGGGHTTSDVVITGDLSLMLRAERSGRGLGRVYTITVGCEDAAGNNTTRKVLITVPR
jgi:hypothetical protein